MSGSGAAARSRTGPDRAGPTGGAVGLTHAAARSLAGEHRGGLALEVDVRLAADVDGDPVQGAAGERPRGASPG